MQGSVKKFEQANKTELAEKNRKLRDELTTLQKKGRRVHGAPRPDRRRGRWRCYDNPRPATPHVFVRGNPDNPGPAVPRQFLEVLSPAERQAVHATAAAGSNWPAPSRARTTR